jgi:C4-dicarboxylate-specific signal transduction histidine kinase
VSHDHSAQHSAIGIVAALRDLATRLPPDHPGWRHLLVLVNRAATFEVVKRGITHNARNKLHTMLMSARALADSPSDNALSARLIPLLVNAATGLEQTLGQLDHGSFGMSGGDNEPISLKDAVGSVVAVVPASRRIYTPPIEVSLPHDLPAVLARELDLEHVLLNLVLNARDSLVRQGAGEIRISARSQDGCVVLSVEDDGPGIPAELAERVFEPFYTTRAAEGHIGLGLTVAALLAQGWGGSVEMAEQRQDSGFRLVVRLGAVRS